MIPTGVGSNANCSFTISGPGPFIAFGLGLIVFVIWVSRVHSKGRRDAEVRADLALESDLRTQITRLKEHPGTFTWAAPKLPASVIASIWTDRFVNTATQPLTETERYESVLGQLTWDYSRKAPCIVAAALLSLRDEGLIRMAVEPRPKILDSFQRVWIERTDLSLSRVDLPAVEGGLLLACLDLGHKRFRTDTEPPVYSVVTEWMHESQNHPFEWVVGVAVQQGRELGLYQPITKKRSRFGRQVDEKLVYSLEHLAACEDQVVACAARWQEFAASEPELEKRLITEVSFAIHGRQARS
jgi:hypothetical protein